MSRRHPYLAANIEGRFIAFAHRGGSQQYPENSLAAFQHAWDVGFRYFETDVQVTADGVLVAFHDDDLQRTCSVPQLISQMNWSEVSQARIDGREAIPTLAELMEEFPEAYFNIDAKSDAAVGPLIAHLRRTSALPRVCIGSFSHSRLMKIRSLLGDAVCTTASPREVGQWLLGRVPSGPSCLQVPIRYGKVQVVTERRIRLAERAQCPVHVWTVDDPNTMQQLIDIGVHGIMTDRGDVLRNVAQLNALWD